MTNSTTVKGPLAGIKVLEIEGIGPGPFCGMLLADLGANVLRVGRPQGAEALTDVPVTNRNRAGRLGINIKSDEGREKVLALVSKADALIEGFRPGVMERLGLGPDACLEANPKLVYGRMTGWGQEGPLASTAGHDIDYIAISGALHAMGSKEEGPIPPLNLVGDFGGGGMLLALGIVSALLESRSSGKGQVIDAAMCDGAGVLMAMIYGLKGIGGWPAERAGNMLDGSFHYYRCFACSDGQWMAAGPIEPQFRKAFYEKLGLGNEMDELMGKSPTDPDVHARLSAIFGQHPREHWTKVFENSDACVAPVVAMSEVTDHPHNKARGNFQVIDGVTHPMPAPRFSRSGTVSPAEARDRDGLMADWGL